MYDNLKEKEVPAPTVQRKQGSEGEPSNAVPFVPHVPHIDNAIFAHRYHPRVFDTNNQVFSPLLNTNRGKTVQYVDLGYRSAKELWAEVVLPAYERFKADPSRANAIIASVFAWQIQDWIWHDQHPGEDTRDSKDQYKQFQEKLFNDCPELTWVRDVADAGKHRGLGRPMVEVREVTNTWPLNATPSIIKLNDGTEHDLADVLLRVIEYWRTAHFP
jgi:hypothetical protein